MSPVPNGTSRHAEPEGTILLADDNADMRDYVSRLLRSKYRVETAANGDEALALALADPPDLVLADVMMPGLDGFELLRALRTEPNTKNVPVVLLVGASRRGIAQRRDGCGGRRLPGQAFQRA